MWCSQVLHQSTAVQVVLWNLFTGVLLELPVQHFGRGQVSTIAVLCTNTNRFWWLVSEQSSLCLPLVSHPSLKRKLCIS